MCWPNGLNCRVLKYRHALKTSCPAAAAAAHGSAGYLLAGAVSLAGVSIARYRTPVGEAMHENLGEYDVATPWNQYRRRRRRVSAPEPARMYICRRPPVRAAAAAAATAGIRAFSATDRDRRLSTVKTRGFPVSWVEIMLSRE